MRLAQEPTPADGITLAPSGSSEWSGWIASRTAEPKLWVAFINPEGLDDGSNTVKSYCVLLTNYAVEGLGVDQMGIHGKRFSTSDAALRGLADALAARVNPSNLD